MILDDAARLEALAAEVTLLRRSQQHGQSLAHRRQIVGTLLTRAGKAWTSGAALAERLGDPQSPSPLFETAIAKIIEWRSTLDLDLGEALGGDLFAGFQTAVSQAVIELERQAADAWQRYSAQRAPEISAEVLAALETDPLAGSTVVMIKRLSGILFRLRDRRIPSPEDLNQFDETAEQLRKAWSNLDVASLSEDIVAFLRAANSYQGAPLDSLTTQVREWLRQRGAASHYVIRPADQ